MQAFHPVLQDVGGAANLFFFLNTHQSPEHEVSLALYTLMLILEGVQRKIYKFK